MRSPGSASWRSAHDRAVSIRLRYAVRGYRPAGLRADLCRPDQGRDARAAAQHGDSCGGDCQRYPAGVRTGRRGAAQDARHQSHAFRIAGGIMLFIIALEMVFEKRQERREDRANKIMETPRSRTFRSFRWACR
ncbi:marC family integral membrane protein domain-containing protein [Ditylenchus destructor]|uniref:MarC family integral membrane protein domain-containing protein n=1 Tax=Ditylenchus destructor TaxID=166010 RepID=A0AAD4QTJ3_9BILA|nr:marC family integral membrane protein domain-containing protein [Ditylenchus destructor]